MSLMNELTHQNMYITGLQLQLKPIGMTRKSLVNDGVLELDDENNKKIEIVTKALDVYYNKFITDILNKGTKLDWDALEDAYYKNYNNEDTSKENEDTSKEKEDSNDKEQSYSSMREAYANEIAGILKKESKDIFTPKFIKDGRFADFVNKNKNLFKNYHELSEMIKSVGKLYTLLVNYYDIRSSIILETKKNSVAERVMTNFEIFVKNKKTHYRMKDLRPNYAAEIEGKIDVEEMFSSFDKYLSQEGINRFNQFISGIHDENDTVGNFDGYNQLANYINQSMIESCKDKSRQDNFHIIKLTQMKKQILSEGKGFNFARFTDNKNFSNELRELINKEQKDSIVKRIINKVKSINNTNSNTIYISKKGLRNISNDLTGSYNALEITEKQMLTSKYLEENKKLTKKAEAEIDKKLKNMSVSIKHIEELISAFDKDEDLKKNLNKKDKLEELKLNNESNYVVGYLDKIASALLINYNKAFENLKIVISDGDYKKENRKLVKNFVDCFVEAKALWTNFEETEDGNAIFYDDTNEINEILKERNTFYNMTRNFVLRKTKEFSNKKKTCLGYISKYTSNWIQRQDDLFSSSDQGLLKRDNKYYYATTKKDSKIKLPVTKEPTSRNYYEKIVVKKFGQPNTTIPKSIFNIEYKAMEQFKDENCMSYARTLNMAEPFIVTRKLYDVYTNRKWSTSYIDFKKDTPEEERQQKLTEFREDLSFLIDNMKDFMLKYNVTNIYDLSKLKSSDEYNNLKDFYDDVSRYTIKNSIGYIDADLFDECVEAGEIYLFELTSRYIKNGRFNDSYSQYLRYLFNKDNLRKNIVTLASWPQFFYRPAAIERKVTHKKGSVLVNKTLPSGEKIPNDIYMEICAYKNKKVDHVSPEANEYLHLCKTKISEIDLIKDKRYTEEMFSIMFSIYVNKNIGEKKNEINKIVKQYIRDNNDVNVLSVVRGEKNILYYMVLDSNKEIISQGSLNVLYGVDFQAKLKSLTYERRELRHNWEDDKTVANIKDGYLHFAISKILNIAKQYNAIICIEDLNKAFKDKRSCLDNQVYERFQTRLQTRMTHYVDKSIEAGKPGSISNPYQLTTDTSSIMVQNGMLFNINPAYTSNICPTTGFINCFNFSGIVTGKKELEFLKLFKEITYDEEYKDGKDKGRFLFKFDYSDFETKVNLKGETKNWTVGSHIKSYYIDSNSKKMIEYNPTKEIRTVLEAAGFNYYGVNIVDSLNELPLSSIRTIFKAFKNSLQMQIKRNIGDEDNVILEDVLISPVVLDKDKVSPINTIEENKAYSIGLKGFMLLEQIRNGAEKLGLKTEDWILERQNNLNSQLG